jgi:1-aminocyclopropane-1-carboxylate deaminase
LLEDAIAKKATKIITYGGVWSNHIAACAATCKLYNIPCLAYIRSDEKYLTPTLQKAMENGMQIEFCTRQIYKEQKTKTGLNAALDYYIPEGGSTILGVKGASEILGIHKLQEYTHIICAVGTGTTFAGLVTASLPHQKVIGINALKGGFVQQQEIQGYLKKSNWEVLADFHFGGFAKYTDELIGFMNTFYEATTIPTDLVYTAKLFYAVKILLQQAYLDKKAKLLVIHSGGLQGNHSLTKGTLVF